MPFENPRIEGAEDPDHQGELVDMEHDQTHDVQGGADGGVYGAAEVAADEEPADVGPVGVGSAVEGKGLAAAEEGPRLPAGTSNEMFRFTEVDSLEYMTRPRTAEQFLRHATASIRAIAITEHAARASEAAERDSERRFSMIEETEKFRSEQDRAVHRADDLMRSTRIPVPGTVSHYTEGVFPLENEDEEPRFGQVVKIQPEPKIPDISDDSLSEEEQMELFLRYRAEVASPTEFSWESDNPDTIMVSSAEGMTPLNELPVDEMIRAAKFLRGVAIWTAMRRDNHAVLERLHPVEGP
jgi:hypothetical protein